MSLATSRGTPIHRSTVHLVKDDITDLDVDAFVLYATSQLTLGSGFGTAISVRGGSAVQKELDALAPVAMCDAVVSTAGKLKAECIVHAVGPKFQEEGTEAKLRRTMINALIKAEAKGLRRIAFPAMGAGYYGIPTDLCARVMLDEIRKHLEGQTTLEEVIICVLDTPQFTTFRARLDSLQTQRTP
jgi:O-acetyl-ADP-ribose deacetylase (regulator of RNase III)